MFLGQDAIMELDQGGIVIGFLVDPRIEEFPIKEQKDRSIMNLGEATLEDDYSEDSFPHGFGIT